MLDTLHRTAAISFYGAIIVSRISRSAREALAHPAARVVVAGSADERGTREYNLALGARRAAAAREALLAGGVSGDRVATVSYGKERPLDPRSTEEAWAQNRNAQTQVREAADRSW